MKSFIFALMKNRFAIGKRIKELRKKNNFSQSYIAEKLFISQAAYSLIENSQNGIGTDHIIKLSQIYGVTTDYILMGNTFVVKISPENGYLPFIKVEAQAGFLRHFGTRDKYDDLEWYRIPGFEGGEDQKLIEVDGKSMLPTVLPGDIVICQTESEIDNVLEGSVVAVVTNDNIYIKRFYLDRNSDFVILKSDNPQEGEKNEHKLHKADVHELMLIRGKITNVLAAQHEEVFSESKIKVLENAIELLREELVNVNRKLEEISDQN